MSAIDRSQRPKDRTSRTAGSATAGWGETSFARATSIEAQMAAPRLTRKPRCQPTRHSSWFVADRGVSARLPLVLTADPKQE
jgi:hypothetical protein